MVSSRLQGPIQIAAALVLVVGFGLLIPQCILFPDSDFTGEIVGNSRPTVQITGGVLVDSSEARSKIHFYWHGADEDGVIRYFEWAIDDTITEQAWRQTTNFDAAIFFQAATLDDSTSSFSDWHTFFVRSVDNDNARSRPDKRYFNSFTIAPTTKIIKPESEGSGLPGWASTLRVQWRGEDLDARGADRLPATYEIKHVLVPGGVTYTDEEEMARLFERAPNLLLGTLDPGDYPSTGEYYKQAEKAWKCVDGSVDTEWLENMESGKKYAFAIRAVDEAGAVEQELRRPRNWMIWVAGDHLILVWIYEAALGGRAFDMPAFGEPWDVTVAPDQTFRFQWVGDASSAGTDPGPCNYGFDIPDPTDETEPYRATDAMGGWIGWATRSRMQEAISFPASDEGKTHFFYLKMRDVSNNRATEAQAVIAVKVARFSFARKFLVVDDLRSSPRSCFGAPPTDEDTDAWRDRVLSSMAEFLPVGEEAGHYFTFGETEGAGAIPDIPENFLDILGRYQTVIWDCGHSAGRVGLRLAAGENMYLSQYVGVGGNLLLFTHQGPIMAITENFPFTRDVPRCPNPGILVRTEYWNEFGFLWQQLYLRGCMAKATGTGMTQKKNSLIGAQALNPRYPDLALDYGPDKWFCGPDSRGIVNFECMTSNIGEEGLDPWYERDTDGLQILYTARTWRDSTKLTGRPVAWKTFTSQEDIAVGIKRGRLVCFSFHPYFFQEGGVEGAMTRALTWLVTNSDY